MMMLKKLIYAIVFPMMLMLLFNACDTGKTNNKDGGVGDKMKIIIPVPEKGESSAETVKSLISEGKTTVFSNGKYLIDSDVVINGDVELGEGTYLEISEGASFTVNGNFSAGKRNIFSGGGKIRLNMPESFGYVDWIEGTVPEKPNDNTVLLQKAVDSLSNLYVTEEGYRASGLTVSSPLNVKGIGSHRVSLTALTKTEKLFCIESSDVSFDNLNLVLSSAQSGCICFYADTSKCDVDRLKITNTYVDGAYCTLADANGEHTASGLYMSGVTMQTSKDTQIDLHDFTSDLTFIEVDVLRRHTADISCNMAGAVIENADGILMEHFDVNGDWTESGTDGHGLILRRCKNVTMRRCLMEYLCGSGFIFENCSDFNLENIQSYSIGNVGILIDGLENSTLNVVKVTNTGDDSQCGKCDNYVIRNSKNIVMNSVISNGAYGAGMRIGNCSSVNINGFIYADVRSSCSEYALVDEGGNSGVSLLGFTDVSTNKSRFDKNYYLTEKGVTVECVQLPGGEYKETTDGKNK